MTTKPPSVLARLGAPASSDESQRKRRATPPPENDDSPDTSPRVKRARLQAAAAPSKDAMMARSRRMFGALMGHLGKAKAQIERDSDLLRRQDARQLAAEKKEQRQSRVLEERAKRVAAVQGIEKLLARAIADRKEQLARAALEHAQQARQSARVAGFLQTVASPPIYYLPAKHTRETEDLVAAAKEAHDAKAQAATRAHEARVRDLEREFDAKIEKYREQLEEAKQRVKAEEKSGGEEVAAEAGGTGEKEVIGKEEKRHRANREEDNAPERRAEEDGDAVTDVGDGDDAECGEGEGDGRKEQATVDVEHHAEGEEHEDDVMERTRDTGSSPSAETSAPDKKSEVNNDTTAAVHEQQVAGAAEEKSAVESEANGSEVSETSLAEEPAAVETPALDVSALKVTELREQLKKRGLDTKGLKAALVARLEEAVRQEAAA